MNFKIYFALTLSAWLTLNSALFAAETQHVQEEQTKKAKLIIYRAKMSPPLAFKPLMTINSVRAFYLPRGHYAELDLDPGEYTILADWKSRHGVSDKEITIKLLAGDERAIEIKSSINFIAVGLGPGLAYAADIASNSSISEEKVVDLSGSTKITRWHPSWRVNPVGGFKHHEIETLSQRYNLNIDSERLISDFKTSNDQEKLPIIRFLAKHEIFEEEILEVVQDEILLNHTKAFETKQQYNTLVHMCKYLASTSNLEYQDTLEKVAKESPIKRVQKYARSYLKSFYGVELEKPE